MSKRKIKDEFILEAQNIHKNEGGIPKYGYNEIGDDVRAKTIIKLWCFEDEIFFNTTVNSHLQGTGCKKCAYKNNGLLKSSKIKSYEEVQLYIKSLNINSKRQWEKHRKNNILPDGIPSNPSAALKTKGWVSWGEFFGTNIVATFKMEFINFITAYKIVKHLNVKSSTDYSKRFNNELIYYNLPSAPDRQYNNKGWVSWGEFLQTGNVCNGELNYLSFEEAKIYVKDLNIKNIRDWQLKSKYLTNIPKIPRKYYKSSGWINSYDFFGINYSKKPGEVAEILLLNLIKGKFNNLTVIHRFRDKWLGTGYKNQSQHLDIYFPNENIAIEYQGGQHFKTVDFWGGKAELFKIQERDLRKYNLCKENNCKLFYFTYEKSHVPDTYLDKVYTDENELIVAICDYMLEQEQTKSA